MTDPEHVSSALSFRVMLRTFLRCYLVGANFNTRGMQNVGLALALDPGLQAIHLDPRELQKARRRSLQHYNTHPYWTPLLAGIFLSLERDIARGILPAPMLQRVKNTTTYTLSALGDSFFGGATLVLCSLVLVLLALNGWPGLAWLWLGSCFLGLQAFKLLTFIGGFREGIGFLGRLKRWNLINWGQRVKLVNAGLLVLLWLQLWPEMGQGLMWTIWTGLIVLGAVATLYLRMSRIWLLLLFVGYWAVCSVFGC